MASHDVFDSRFARTIRDLTMEELLAKQKEIEAIPENRNPPGSFFIFTKKARAKLNAIAYAIADRLREKKENR